MSNLYATLTDLKGILGMTSTTDDSIMLRIIEAASRSIDSFCSRYFYVETATKYFDGEGENYLLVSDLLTITSVGEDSDGDEDYTDYAWATTDYFLYPSNKYPKTYLEVNTLNGDYSVFTAGKHNFKIVGTWGYGDGLSATPYLIDTKTAEIITAGQTEIDVVSATNLSAGHTLLLVDADTGKSNEQMYINSISTNALTVERGVNGTTDAAHAITKQLYYYRYPRDVWQACIDLSVALYQNRAKKGMDSERLGDYAYSVSNGMMHSLLSDLVYGYRKLRI